jgi:acyl-CoA thioesterase 8
MKNITTYTSAFGCKRKGHLSLCRMMCSTKTFANPIDLEMLDVDLFRSKSLWRPQGARAVFGGQVVGQALAASTQCIKDNKELHSLHSYFLKGGDPEVPILYRVTRLNSTNNFETHSICANQYGQTIFSCQASYHRPEKSSLFHERTMPIAPNPETLSSQEDNMQKLLNDPRLPEKSRIRISESLKTPFLIDVRECTPIDVFKPEKRLPSKLVWMKTKHPLGECNVNLHRCFAAYASDWGLASASLLPHGLFFGHPKMKVCSA